MPSETTTRRALEVCMSRLPMHRNIRDWFAHQLAVACTHGESRAAVDIDARRATLVRALSDLEGVDESYSKSLLIVRMRDAAQTLRSVLDE